MSGTYDPSLGWVPDTPDMYASQNGIDFGGWSQTLQDIARLGVNTWAQTTLMQQNQQGQRYIEGQRIAALQSGGLNLNTLLLIGAGVAVFMMMKD